MGPPTTTRGFMDPPSPIVDEACAVTHGRHYTGNPRRGTFLQYNRRTFAGGGGHDEASRAVCGARMSGIAVRSAVPGDAEAIAAIYNQGIEDRVATLETELRTADERREWMGARGPRHPVIVAEIDGHIVGWGSLNVYNPRAAYQHVADFSVYVERAWRGKRVGRRLLKLLIEQARA